MKKLIFTLALGLICAIGYSQTLKPEQVPQLIKDRVQFKFPQTIDVPVSWTREKNGDYKGSLTIMDAPAWIIVDTVGVIKRVERRIHETYLPDKAKSYLKSIDSDYKVVSILQITDEKENVTYKAVARVKTDFTFDGKGNHLSGAKK